MDGREVHWRPKVYWPAGTKVTVEAKVYGKHLGGGLWGQEDRKASFTIGKSKIAIADSKTKRMKVYIDGKQVTPDQRPRRESRHPDQHGQGRHRAPVPAARSSTSGPAAARTW